MSMNTLNVRCGLEASTKKLPYEIRTENAQKYLEDKFRFINNGLRSRGEKDVKDITPTLKTIRIGTNFFPFVIMLPESILDRKAYDPNTPSVFRPDYDDDVCMIKPYYYRFLANYMYTKRDVEAFGSGDWKRAAGVKPSNGKMLDTLRHYVFPKIEVVNGEYGQSIYVVMILDPIKIFHEMLISNDNPNQRFSVFITGLQEVDMGSYSFTISREVNKKNQNDAQEFKLILQAMDRTLRNSQNR